MAVNDTTSEVESIQPDPNARLREFVSAVKMIALGCAIVGNTPRRTIGTANCELAAAGHHDEPAAEPIQRGCPCNDTNEHFIESERPDQTRPIGLQ